MYLSFIHLVIVIGRLNIASILICKTYKGVGETIHKIVIAFCRQLKYNQSKRKKKEQKAET